jgi:signal transduction histidine kinase
MASAPSEPRAVHGRIDREGRLIEADAALEALQRDAGSAVGKALALPQVAAIAKLARVLGTTVSRPAVAASSDHDIELCVQATPQGDDVLLALEGWTERAPAAPRLATILRGSAHGQDGAARNEWATDEELRLIALSGDLAELLGVEVGEATGQPLTRVVRLDEDDNGKMPLLSAVAARRAFSGQRARSRADNGRVILLSGEVVTAADGVFAGFRGSAVREEDVAAAAAQSAVSINHSLDEVLRSPLDRIIESAGRITDRADGPLRSDYASYGNDIAAAARHLLSVLTTMSRDPGEEHRSVDLSGLAAEAAVMLESSAQERGVTIELEPADPLPARGEERAVIQILVNLLVNAIRYSPEGGTVRLSFAKAAGTASAIVSDEGPGVAEADQQRIFQRFERAQTVEAGTGLGLAISRRLARSMGGDVTLDSAPGEGARFSLILPSA